MGPRREARRLAFVLSSIDEEQLCVEVEDWGRLEAAGERGAMRLP